MAVGFEEFKNTVSLIGLKRIGKCMEHRDVYKGFHFVGGMWPGLLLHAKQPLIINKRGFRSTTSNTPNQF